VLLEKIRIQNFRQYEDVTIPFERGLTAIVGPNGAGKSTIVEAIGFALYGEQRSTKDTLKPVRTNAGEPSVTLWFQLGQDKYRVHRTMKTASLCLVTDVEEILAQTLSGVTEEVRRRLGLTHDQFVNSFCTQQKKADFLVFSNKGKKIDELARMLGYDDLKKAAQLALAAANTARVQQEALWEAARSQEDAKQRQELAAARVDQERKLLLQYEADAKELLRSLEEWKPKADAAKRVADLAVELGHLSAQIALTEEHMRDRAHEREEAEKRVRHRAMLEDEAREYERLKSELEQWEALRAKATEVRLARSRLAQLEQEVRELQDELAGVDEGGVATLEQELEEATRALGDLQAEAERQRRVWQEAVDATRKELAQLEAEERQLSRRLAELQGAVKDGVCITCGQPLPGGRLPEQDSVEARLEEARRSLERVQEEAKRLEAEPDSIGELRKQIETSTLSLKEKEAALAVAKDRAQKAARLREQLGDKRKEAELVRAQCAEEVPFDESVYESVKTRLSELEKTYREYLSLATAQQALDEATTKLAQAEAAWEELKKEKALREQEIAATGMTVEEARQALEAFQQKEIEARSLVEKIEGQKKVLQGAEQALADAQEAAKRYEEMVEQANERARAETLNQEVRKAMESLSKKMTEEIRPELERYASDYIAELSRGRYRKIELDDDFVPTLIDDLKGAGWGKKVISGGEEDLVQLSLRLALSHYIRANADQSLSLLILDEVFGSLDEDRRHATLDQLRALSDLFEQVLIISHIDAINEAADRVIEVRYDAEAGVSRVSGTDIPDEQFALTAQ
jgi:exonuclease SbcC